MKNQHLTGIKSQKITPLVRNIIRDMSIKNALDTTQFLQATQHEQNLIRNVAKLFDVDIDVEEDDSFDNEFNILIGEYEAGNDSVLLRNKIKKYISHGMKIGKLTKKHGYDLLLELSL